MRQRRIKVPAEDGDAIYHCLSRTVNGEWLFDVTAREILRRQFWQVAEFCGIEIITYAILSNHFHLLVRVPRRTEIPDEELLRRYAVLYPKPTRFQTARIEVIRGQLAADGPEAAAWRCRQLALMGDISPFMKLVKQRFSIWYNKTHDRFGTLWSERFKSILVEDGRALRTIAAYIDLNPVRAGLIRDPKDYRFCGYAEAVAGRPTAMRGLATLFGETVVDPRAEYRQILFGTGADEGIPIDALRKVIREGGRLPMATLLRCRIRYFSDGAVIGSRAFVALQLSAYREKTGRRRESVPHLLPAVTDWGDMSTLRGLRRSVFG